MQYVYIYIYILDMLSNSSDLQSLIVTGIVICIITFLISNMGAHLLAGNMVISVTLSILAIVLFLNLAAIGRQPVQRTELSFKVKECACNTNCTYTLIVKKLDCFTFYDNVQ